MGSDIQFIIVPLQMLQEEGFRAYSRALDLVLDQPPLEATPNPPAPIKSFMQQHHAAIVQLWRRRRGLIYIHDRLDEPPPAYAPGYSIDPAQQPTLIGGYQAVFLSVETLRRIGQNTARAMVDHAYPDRVIVHCRVAHPTQPETKDQLHLAALLKTLPPAKEPNT